MKDFTSSIDREQLASIKKDATPEQCMNWLVDAIEFTREIQKSSEDNLSAT